MSESPLAAIRALLRGGAIADAEARLAEFIAATFDLPLRRVEVARDGYSLNSVHGIARTRDGADYFFKFHQEEGEEETVAEYYRAELLEQAGFPVDRPSHVSRAPGRQILLYPLRADPRLADLCVAAEAAGDAVQFDRLAAAQRDLDRVVGERYLATLHEAAEADYAAEPILQLFLWRLVDHRDDRTVGGRARRYYADRPIALPGLDLVANEVLGLRWTINGVTYPDTLRELFAAALSRLQPAQHPRYPAVVAHGDAHNANVWWRDGKLAWFDPAFAGRHVPALLAEVKATFHNILAHPLWLYHPQQADPRIDVRVRREGGRLIVEHDWRLTPLRRAFLDSKVERVWRPLLAELARRGWLAADWRRFLRLALFCCPTLVMPLVAGEGIGGAVHTPKTALLGLAIAVMCGSEPADGPRDAVADFLDRIAP